MISVVVATYNRADILREHVESVLHQKDVEYEVIYVDDGSTDATPHVLAEYASTHPDRFRWLRVANNGQGLARNAGAAIAHGDLLVFTDDDVTVPSDWLIRLLDVYRAHPCGAASGGFAPYSMETSVERYLHHRMRILFGDHPCCVRAAPMMNFIVPRDLFEAVGGFVAEPIEDWVLCREIRRRGHRIRYAPSVTVTHRYQREWEPMVRRMRMHAALGIYDRMNGSGAGAAYLAYSAAKLAAAPLWSLWRYPLDLYGMSLKVEAIFFMARLKAYALSFVGRRLVPPDWTTSLRRTDVRQSS